MGFILAIHPTLCMAEVSQSPKGRKGPLWSRQPGSEVSKHERGIKIKGDLTEVSVTLRKE